MKKKAERYHPGDPVFADYACSEPPGQFEFHFHDNYELYFFLSGDAEMMVEQTRYPLQRGSLLAMGSNEIHRVFPAPTAPYERLTIHFDPHLIRSLPLQSCNLLACFQNHAPGSQNATLLTDTAFTEYFHLAKELVAHARSDNYGSEALMLSCLTRLLVLANEAFHMAPHLPMSYSGFVPKAIAYIEDHRSEPFTVQDIAEVLSVNPFYLSHQFRQQTGVPIYHYILVKKIALSKLLLSQGLPAGDVCEQAGFGDYNNFSRTFKKYVGYSPSEYKKRRQRDIASSPISHGAH